MWYFFVRKKFLASLYKPCLHWFRNLSIFNNFEEGENQSNDISKQFDTTKIKFQIRNFGIEKFWIGQFQELNFSREKKSIKNSEKNFGLNLKNRKNFLLKNHLPLLLIK